MIISICCKIFKVCLTIMGHYALKSQEMSELYSVSSQYFHGQTNI